MKKAIRIAVAPVCIAAFIGYIALIGALEGPIMLDISDRIESHAAEHEISLPWYLHMVAEPDVQFHGIHGTDSHNQQYTWFVYEFPDIVASTEMDCIACWDTNTVKAYIGESKAMEIIKVDFPDIQWN